MGSFGLAELNCPVPLAAFTVSAKMTALARKLIAMSSVTGLSLRPVEFDVGRGGFDPFDPTKATLVDSQAISLIDPVLTGQPITQYERANSTCCSCYCEIDPGDANFLLGEIAIWALLREPPTFADLGVKHVFAIGHFPAKAKNSNMKMAIRVLIQD